MENLPLVSIITPAYNQAEYLAETIESVLAQDYPNIEYIVLDDGSTDATAEVLRRYDGRIRWESQQNMGQARTLNKGWAMAKGAYLSYLSSDDILYPGAVRKLVEILEKNQSTVCAFPDSTLIDQHSKITKKNACRPFDLADLIIKQECYIGPGAIFRRAAFESVGGWKPELRLAPDREFWIRLSVHGSFHFHRESLAGYRIHQDSISYKDIKEETAREYILVLDHYFQGEGMPENIVIRKDEAYGYANLILARNSFRSGKIKRGIELYRVACDFHPPLGAMSHRLKLCRNVISKPMRIFLGKVRNIINA